MRAEEIGVVTGFEKQGEEDKRRIKVDQFDVNGNVFIRRETFVEDVEDIDYGDGVYPVGRNMLSVWPICEKCEQTKFLLDDDTLYCPGCESGEETPC